MCAAILSDIPGFHVADLHGRGFPRREKCVHCPLDMVEFAKFMFESRHFAGGRTEREIFYTVFQGVKVADLRSVAPVNIYTRAWAADRLT